MFTEVDLKTAAGVLLAQRHPLSCEEETGRSYAGQKARMKSRKSTLRTVLVREEHKKEADGSIIKLWIIYAANYMYFACAACGGCFM